MKYMKLSTLVCIALTLITLKFEQTQSLRSDITMEDTSASRIDLDSPKYGSMSSGILRSQSRLFRIPHDMNKTLILKAPDGYGVLAAIKLLDLRPAGEDTLTLFQKGSSGQNYTYTNKGFSRNRRYDSNEKIATFYASNGQLGVYFKTGSEIFTYGCEGFELVFTVQADFSKCEPEDFRCHDGKCIASILACDGHNHCGDRSDQEYCNTDIDNIIDINRKIHDDSSSVRGTIFAIVGGVFGAIAVLCIIIILVRRSQALSQVRVVTTHPPPPRNLPSYPQPGTYYPPPPPSYSQSEGMTNPAYR